MLDGKIGTYFRYGAFAFAHRLEANCSRVNALHRRMVICCARLYRTVSYFSATAIANYPPLVLIIVKHALMRCYKEGWTLSSGLPLSMPSGEGLQSVRESLKLQLKEVWQRR